MLLQERWDERTENYLSLYLLLYYWLKICPNMELSNIYNATVTFVNNT